MRGSSVYPGLAMVVAVSAFVSVGRPAAAGPATRPAIDEQAIAHLKAMSETLGRAKTLSFRTESAVAIASPSGQWVHVFGTSRVVLRRPDKLYVETRGDLFHQNFYFNGRQATMFAPDQNIYAADDISGRVDEMILRIYEKHGNYFPFADVLHADPHAAMTRRVISAQYVGTSTVGGVKTDHLAFAGGGLEWEIWIGAEDRLPRMLNVTFAEVQGRPQNSIVFADWRLDAGDVSDDTFTFAPPSGAQRIEFRNPGPSATVEPPK